MSLYKDGLKEKFLMIKSLSLILICIDGSTCTVTIKNWMFHIYYQISIFPMNE